MIRQLRANLSVELDPEKFRSEWEKSNKFDAPPPVDFRFDGKVIDIWIQSASSTCAWEEDNFKQSFGIVCRTVAPECHVVWL